MSTPLTTLRKLCDLLDKCADALPDLNDAEPFIDDAEGISYMFSQKLSNAIYTAGMAIRGDDEDAVCPCCGTPCSACHVSNDDAEHMVNVAREIANAELYAAERAAVQQMSGSAA